MRFAALLLCLLPLVASAAINPAEFTRRAPLTLQIRVDARISDDFVDGGRHLRRNTVVGEVLEDRSTPDKAWVGRTVVVDWTVDVGARDQARADHERRMGNMPGPQFMSEPDLPAPDADGRVWVNAAEATASDDSRRYAGALAPAANKPAAGEVRDGHLLLPAAGQYSFDRPYE